MVDWINFSRFPLGSKCNLALIIVKSFVWKELNLYSKLISFFSISSFSRVLLLITLIQQKVLQKKGIYLQPEVRMIGFDYPY